LFQGEFLGVTGPVTRTRRVENPRESAAYTFGYNHSLFAQRVHDVLTVAAWLGSRPAGIEGLGEGAVGLLGLGEAGRWAVAARALAPEAFRLAAINTGGFRFVQVSDLHDPSFLPGGARYLDLPGMVALGGAKALWLAGEGEQRRELPRPIRRTYREARDKLTLAPAGSDRASDAVAWLLGANWD